MTTAVERAIEILRTTRPCGLPNTVGGHHEHGTMCDLIDGPYTPAEADDLTRNALAAQDPTTGALYITDKGKRAVPEVRITVNDRPALTTAQAARRHHRSPAAMRDLLSARRLNLAPVDMLDPRTPLYDQEQLDTAIAGMVGRGVGGGRPRKFIVTLGSAEEAQFIADMPQLAGNGHNVEVDGSTVTLTGAALNVLGELPDDNDGHFDGRYIWVGGSEYTVVR